MQQVLTVTQLNAYLKAVVDSDAALRGLTVKGEISNFTNHQRSGHFYFSLKDASCTMRVVMFKTYASCVQFEPQNGMNVLVSGSIRLFERDGAIQLYGESMQPDGIGALYLAYEQLKERLQREGLFDESHKQVLPAFPKRIGVITSKTGAALQDIYNILARRYPIGQLLLIPALVQGKEAPASICRAIEWAQTVPDLDVLIVGRGGGSLEDLWAFNDERVARAIYACPIPIISAVGHEIDYTIADFAADLRAPTPSAAAELAVPDCGELQRQLDDAAFALNRCMQSTLTRGQESLQYWEHRLQTLSPMKMLQDRQEATDEMSLRLQRAMAQLLEQKKQQFLQKATVLEALNPLRVLTRGYTITYYDDAVLTADTAVEVGHRLTTALPGLELESIVETVRRKEEKTDGREEF